MVGGQPWPTALCWVDRQLTDGRHLEKVFGRHRPPCAVAEHLEACGAFRTTRFVRFFLPAPRTRRANVAPNATLLCEAFCPDRPGLIRHVRYRMDLTRTLDL